MAEVQPEKIRTNCSNCGAEYVVFAGLAGKQVRCVKCQTSFTVPPAQAPADRNKPDQTRPKGSPASPADKEAKGSKGSADHYLKWLAEQMTEIVCPHCRLVYPISKSFIGQYMACPRCRRKFVISPHGHALVHQSPYERFMEDKAAVKAVVVASAVLVLIVLVSILVVSSRKSYLLGSLRGAYPAPKYTLSQIKTPKVDFVHKVYDGSRKCPAVAYVHVAHPKTGMEFDRMLCRVDGVWSPTYYQRLLDEAAVRYLEDLESGDYRSFDLNDMIDAMLGDGTARYGEAYNRAPDQEAILKKSSISAYDQLTHGNDRSYSGFFDDEDEDEDFEYSSYQDRYYLAQAVVYPDQAYELFRKRLIKEMP
jgi:hypothetical protein